MEKTDWLSLSERCDNSWDLILSFWKYLRGLPQSVSFVWFNHLTILEWRQWSHLTFNQSTKILILGFSPFFSFLKKLRLFWTTREHQAWGSIMRPIEGWQWIVTLWYVKLSQFKIVEWFQGSVDPTQTWWHVLIPKEFIQQRPPLDLKGILKSLHEWLTSNVPYYHNCLWAFSTSSWLNKFSSKCASAKPRGFFFSHIYIFNNHKRVQVSLHNPNLKAKLVIPWSTWDLLGL